MAVAFAARPTSAPQTRPSWLRWLIPLGILVASVLVSVVSLSVGARPIPLTAVPAALFRPDSQYSFIVQNFRLPRILLAWVVGAALAVSGGVIQGVIRNPLAAPDVIGVTGGASLGAVLLLVVLGTAPVAALPVAAFLGGILAATLIYAFAYQRGVAPARLALVGIALNAVCLSVIRYFLVTFPLNINAALVWLSGSLFGRTLSDFLQVLPWVVILVPVTLFYAHRLDVLGLGDDLAIGLGERVQRTRAITLALAVALAGAAVSVAGVVGFIGLVAPHMARRLVGGRHLIALPTAALVGALLMLVADAVGRSIKPPLEIPAGLVTAVVGGPYFLYLLARTGRGSAQ